MPSDNMLSYQIPAETLSKVIANLKECAELMQPYFISLGAEERKTLPKMSDKTVPFVDKVLSYIETNPEFAPAYMDAPELKKDMAAFGDLESLHQLAKPFLDNLADTQMRAGSEAYVAALVYYHSVKQAAKMNVPNAKTIYEDLQKRFSGRPSEKTSSETDSQT